MERVLEGDVSRFSTPDVLTFLNMARRTGVLVMERPEQETKLFFRAGSPVFATSSKEELRLGSMLVRMNKLGAADLERLLGGGRMGGFRLGQALVSERVLEESELASFLKVQVSEVIFETFGWTEGVFSFWDAVPPPATAITLEMDLQNLIMEGVRRLDDRARLAEVFPDRTLVVESVANPERIKQSVTLTPEEWKVFFLVDGRRTVDEICRLAGNPDELTTLQIVHNLLQANFVVLVPPHAEESAATPPPAEMNPHPTVKSLEGKPDVPAPPVSVEFASAVPQRVSDDAKEVVSPLAIQYLGNSRVVTMSRLVLVVDTQETSFPLTRDSYTVGRHRNNDIVVTDPKVSSFHARIDRSEDGFVLVDLKSRNGCYVNGRKAEQVVLKTDDEIRLGMARLLYRVDYTQPVP